MGRVGGSVQQGGGMAGRTVGRHSGMCASSRSNDRDVAKGDVDDDADVYPDLDAEYPINVFIDSAAAVSWVNAVRSSAGCLFEPPSSCAESRLLSKVSSCSASLFLSCWAFCTPL
jgi:hypothetical protein